MSSFHTSSQIARETGLAQASVVRIIHRDLGLKFFKRRCGQELNEANHQARLSRSKMLLAKYSESDVNFMVHRRKSFYGGHAKKFTERPTLRSCIDDEEAYPC